MPILQEVPGALERPGGCRVRLSQSDDGRETTLVIPPREAPWWMLLALGVLGVNLLLVLVTGAMLLFAHRSVLFMAQIAPGDVPPTMRRFAPWYAFGWATLLALGVALLQTLVRPLLLWETITVGPNGVTRERLGWLRPERAAIPLSELRGFHLARDPQRLIPSVLSVESRGDQWVIGESLREADREWLASVGVALLRSR